MFSCFCDFRLKWTWSPASVWETWRVKSQHARTLVSSWGAVYRVCWNSTSTQQCLSDKVEGTKLISKHLPVWLLKSETVQTLFKKIVLISKNLSACMGIVFAFCLYTACEPYPWNQVRALNPLSWEANLGTPEEHQVLRITAVSLQFKLFNTHFSILLEPGRATVL